MKKRVLVLLGPNLNMVGIREKGVYGDESAESIEEQIRAKAESMGYVCDIFQSNWEGALIDKIHEARERYDGVVLNAGALTKIRKPERDPDSGLHDQHPLHLQSTQTRKKHLQRRHHYRRNFHQHHRPIRGNAV